MDMPYGYRWIAKSDFDERSEYALSKCKPFMGGTIIPWDCMIEFGMDHDHDPEKCERIMADMNPEPYDDTDYSGWYGGERGYNDGLRWSDFV